MVSEGIIEKLMLVILPVVAVYVLWNKNLGDDSKAGTISAGRKFAVSLAAAFIVGTYDALRAWNGNLPDSDSDGSGPLYHEGGGGNDKGD